MKKKIIFTALMSVFSVSLFVVSLKANMTESPLLTEDIESLSQTISIIRYIDGDINNSVIKCRCSVSEFFPNKKCMCSNDGNTCAQSEAGGNIDCQEWNKNCGGH